MRKMDRAEQLIRQLELAGHKTYIVGGAVRNRLLGIPLKDIDLVTLGSPEDVCSVAKKNNWTTHQVGRRFGIVVVVIEGKAYEVASARKEQYGEDSHRPEEVHFVHDIKEDLARRDFTINAMAFDSSDQLLDPFNGQKDLECRIIRAVGDPVQRFSEDGLRSFRAVRFAAELGFEIEPETLRAIPMTLYRVMGLSAERVYSELEKILVAPYAAHGLQLLVDTGLAGSICTSHRAGVWQTVPILEELLHLQGLPQNPRYHLLDAWKHTLATVEGTPPEPTLRWAALFHDAGKGKEGVRGFNKYGELSDPGHAKVSAGIASKVLSRLKAPRSMADRVTWLVYNHMSLPDPDFGAVVKWLRKRSRDFGWSQELEEAVGQLFVLCRADAAAAKINQDFRWLDTLEEIFTTVFREIPFYHADLAIRGNEVADLLGKGPQIRHFLDSVLVRVQEGELENNPDSLREALEKKYRRNLAYGIVQPNSRD